VLSKKPLLKKWRENLSPQRFLLLGFILIIAMGTLLLSLPIARSPGFEPDFLTALFTATSATCVTGLVVVDTGTHWSTFGHIVIISLIQIGGLGFMTMATLILIMLGRRIGLRQRIVIQQSINQVHVGGIIRLIKQVLVLTVIVEGIFAIILATRFAAEFGLGKGIWFGVFHSVSAFNNAGFDLFGGFRSLTAYPEDIVVSLGIIIPVIIGGLGFIVIADLYERRRFRLLSLHSKVVLVGSGILILFGTLAVLLLEFNNALAGLSPAGKVLAAFFQAVTPRSAGFTTVAVDSYQSATQFLTVALMFIGGGPNSVTGGIKVSTFIILILMVITLYRGSEEVEAFRRRVPRYLIYKAVTLSIILMFLVFAVTMILSVTEKADFLTTLFEATSAIGIVGLSMGLTPELSPIGRIVVIVCMIIGRVGPLTIAYALLRRRHHPKLKHPEEQIIIG
jgi:trk system potassium uptake protein TrkH